MVKNKINKCVFLVSGQKNLGRTTFSPFYLTFFFLLRFHNKMFRVGGKETR